MGRILVHGFSYFSHGSHMGRSRPNRRSYISPLRWALQMKKLKEEKNSPLAVSIYVSAMKKQIEEEFESKYSKRINYLVGANNELARELKKCEEDRIKMASIADNIVLSKEEEYKSNVGKVYSDGRGGVYQAS